MACTLLLLLLLLLLLPLLQVALSPRRRLRHKASPLVAVSDTAVAVG
jgi:hypothetical protein